MGRIWRQVLHILLERGTVEPHLFFQGGDGIGRCLGSEHLHGRVARIISTDPIDNQVSVATILPVFVPVNHQTIVVDVSFQITLLHVIVVVNPLDREAVCRNRAQYIRVTVVVEVNVSRLLPHRSGR